MSVLKKIGSLKYRLARLIEGNPRLSNAIYNNISHFKFLFPHEKDYYGIPFFCEERSAGDFIDIGANIGLSTIGFRALGYKNKVILFEANPFLAGFLQKLAKSDDRIEIHQLALGNENAMKEIHLPYYGSTCLHTFSSFDREGLIESLEKSFPTKHQRIEIRSTPVHLRRFDDMKVSSAPRFVKIDVEGFEHEIIKGMAGTIREHRPVFLIEYNPANFSQVYELLKPAYSLYAYDYAAARVVSIDPSQLLKFADPNDPSRIRNLFFVPVTPNRN